MLSHVHAIIKSIESAAHATICLYVWTLANPQAEIRQSYDWCSALAGQRITAQGPH